LRLLADPSTLANFLSKSNYAVLKGQCPEGFPAALRVRRRKEFKKFLLFSKRNHGIIPVGNLKVGDEGKAGCFAGNAGADGS
jgi:hypothetical protein